MKDMMCKECGSKMYLDDKDFNFKGNYDNYWCCEDDNCLTSCIEQVRFGQSFKEIWHSENNDEVKDYVIKHPLKEHGRRVESPQVDKLITNAAERSNKTIPQNESQTAGKNDFVKA